MFSYDIVNLFIYHLKNKKTISQISNILNISRKQLYIWKNMYKEYIFSRKAFFKKDFELLRNKRLYTKTDRYKKTIIDFVNNNKGSSLKEIYDHINKELSISLLCRLLKELNIVRRRKKMRITNKSSDELNVLRKSYMAKRYWDPLNDAVYIDEVHFSVSDLSNYGYTFKGESISQINASRSKIPSVSVLCAMTKDRIIYQIYNESINQEKYIAFLKKIRKYFKNKVFIQDNARIHKGNLVKKYQKKSKIILEYTPPYSPEFNPIELLFNRVKNTFRKVEHKNITNEIALAFNGVKISEFEKFINHSEDLIEKYL